MITYLILLIASALEIAWAVGLKYASSPIEYLLTVLCIFGSFIFLVVGSKRITPPFAYILFVIFGTVGTFLLDVIYFGKMLSLTAILAIGTMLFGVVMLNKEK